MGSPSHLPEAANVAHLLPKARFSSRSHFHMTRVSKDLPREALPQTDSFHPEETIPDFLLRLTSPR